MNCCAMIDTEVEDESLVSWALVHVQVALHGANEKHPSRITSCSASGAISLPNTTATQVDVAL